jgi:hypothetical protein
MITAVNHDVTVGTCPVLEHSRLLINACALTCRYRQKLPRVNRVGVATLTEQRFFDDQQGFMRAAVRVMAVEATLANRRVFPKEGPTLLAMTFVTLVIHRVRCDQPLSLCAVGIVAVGADQFSFTKGVMGGFHQSCADLLVAPGTELQLGGLGQKLQISAVNPVAINTGQLGFVVFASVP